MKYITVKIGTPEDWILISSQPSQEVLHVQGKITVGSCIGVSYRRSKNSIDWLRVQEVNEQFIKCTKEYDTNIGVTCHRGCSDDHTPEECRAL